MFGRSTRTTAAGSAKPGVCCGVQMLVVTELDDPFLPMPDDLLVNLHDSRELVDALLDALPAGYSANTSNDSAMGPALQVGQAGKGWKHTLHNRGPSWDGLSLPTIIKTASA